ncbi:hypothetical protein Tco_0597866 [Tanacetum coccineum]
MNMEILPNEEAVDIMEQVKEDSDDIPLAASNEKWISSKTETSQMTKPEPGMEKTVPNQGQRPKNDKVRSIIMKSAANRAEELKNTIAHQGPAPQTHGVSKTDFERYVTANDAVLRNMQNQGQNLQSQMANLTDMLSKFVTANTASTSGSGTLPGNTVTNPKEDLKGITTRSGVTIQGPKAVNHDAEVTKDTMPPANNGSTENVQPPVVPIQSRNPNPEPNVAPVVTPVPKASIPFPSRRNDEKRKEKANDQNEK